MGAIQGRKKTMASKKATKKLGKGKKMQATKTLSAGKVSLSDFSFTA